MPEPLRTALADALAARRSLIEQLLAETTTAYRLFHGAADGFPGLSVDRYGDALLVQTILRPLAAGELAELDEFYRGEFPGLPLFYNDHSQDPARISNALPPAMIAAAHELRLCRELGAAYRFQARHAGTEPWLALDRRPARRRVMQEAGGKSLLNLFATTGSVGIAAARAGARHVVNVEPSESNITLAKDNARLNELPIRLRFVKSDVFAALRQLSGQGQGQMVRGRRMPPFPKLEAHVFDLVFLDPPSFAKSPFGVVDQVNDYAALYKPALLCTAPGGSLICTNGSETSREAWLDQLERSTRKVGRNISEVEWIEPEADFPSATGAAPLKVVLLRV